jgi:hypothetical protein
MKIEENLQFIFFIVNCDNCNGNDWDLKHSELESHQGFLRSNDTINLSIMKWYDNKGNHIQDGQVEFLHSQDIQFTIGNDAFQEVTCHNERLGGNDEVSRLILF